jgi:hypothetical protein
MRPWHAAGARVNSSATFAVALLNSFATGPGQQELQAQQELLAWRTFDPSTVVTRCCRMLLLTRLAHSSRRQCQVMASVQGDCPGTPTPANDHHVWLALPLLAGAQLSALRAACRRPCLICVASFPAPAATCRLQLAGCTPPACLPIGCCQPAAAAPAGRAARACCAGHVRCTRGCVLSALCLPGGPPSLLPACPLAAGKSLVLALHLFSPAAVAAAAAPGPTASLPPPHAAPQQPTAAAAAEAAQAPLPHGLPQHLGASRLTLNEVRCRPLPFTAPLAQHGQHAAPACIRATQVDSGRAARLARVLTEYLPLPLTSDSSDAPKVGVGHPGMRVQNLHVLGWARSCTGLCRV